MNQNDKYADLDKEMSKKIMAEFEGKEVEHICPHCHGEQKIETPCDDCGGSGIITIKY